MSEFTKGPWTVIKEGEDDTLPSKGYISIQPIDAYIDHGRRGGINDEDRANAELIASAPTLKQQRDDLLGACKTAEAALKIIKAAIAKCEAS
ncbi:MAG TPA: hypothetical protein ENH82_18565 [bacterium]|nr:hypothetical protein [bacterium]